MRAAAAIVAALLVAACASPAPAQGPAPSGPQPVSAQPPAGTAPAPAAVVELDNAGDGRMVRVPKGGEVKLVLDLNGMYELAWEMERKVEPTLAPIGERIYVGKGSNGYDVLAGGYSIYRFRAEQPGSVTLQLSKHSRADGKTLATVHYDVTVE